MSEAIGFSSREYEVAPAGYYDAQIVGIYNVGRHFDNYYQKYKPTVKVKFEISCKDSEGRPICILEDYNATMGPKAALRKLAHSVAGRDLTDDEARQWGLKDFAGKHCLMGLSVVQLKSDPTRSRNKITGILPPKQPVYSSESTPEAWDYRFSHPDDCPNWIWDAYSRSQDYRPPAVPRKPRPMTPLGEAVAQGQTQPAAPATSGGPEIPWE